MSAPRPQINRDEIEPHSVGAGELAFTRQRLAPAGGAAGNGCRPFPVSARGDVVGHRPREDAHPFLAGEHGLELLAFGNGSDTSITWLPRAEVMWCGPRWVPLDAPHPFEAEARAGALTRPQDTSRPSNVVALADVAPRPFPGAQVRALGQAAGSVAAGLNHVTLPAGAAGAA